MAPEAPRADAIGSVIARKYRVDAVLGQGGMGVVLAATHLHLGERVAIKLLRGEAAARADAVSRFLREARAASRIRSEHVARVFDVGTLDDGAPFLVMEYLEGRDLASELAARRALPPEEAVEAVLQASEAIAEAHAMGIVHRDLKPANLFLTRRPDGTRCVKVLDFGVSKFTAGESGGANDTAPASESAARLEERGPPAARPDMTRSRATLGSPRYMAPEQVDSARDADARTDIWALGTIVFELVTGAPAFPEEDEAALRAAIRGRMPPPVSSIVRDVPPGLDAAVKRCLAKSRDERFADLAELARALAPHGTAAAAASAPRIARVLGEAREAEIRPGAMFGHYVVEALIGEGGMGRVCRARDERLERRVALKILRTERGPGTPEATNDDARRLVREARAAAQLDHPNAAAIFDVGEHEGVPFFAMELIEGRTLRDYVGDANVSVATRVRWLCDVARVLAAAHLRGLVHRDVKPENVMVRADGVVKVLDFGIARRVGPGDAPAIADAAKSAVVTEYPGSGIIGTPQYMAPEQFAGGAIDGRADQFAWAVLAQELLTGSAPWSRAQRPLHERVPGLDPRVSEVVARALSGDREARFSSMSEILDRIEPAIHSVPPSALSSLSSPELGARASQPHETPRALSMAQRDTLPPARRRGWKLAVGLGAAVMATSGLVAIRARGPASSPGETSSVPPPVLAAPVSAPSASSASAPAPTPAESAHAAPLDAGAVRARGGRAPVVPLASSPPPSPSPSAPGRPLGGIIGQPPF